MAAYLRLIECVIEAGKAVGRGRQADDAERVTQAVKRKKR